MPRVPYPAFPGNLSDDDFAAEVRRHQAAHWRPGRLVEHARKHRRDFTALLGRALSAAETAALTHGVLRSWDRLFAELGPDGSITCHFAQSLSISDAAIIVVTRGSFVRTAFPTKSLHRWSRRKRAIIEVTERAKRLGLSD